MDERTRPLCGVMGLADGSVCWRVWAPRARHVDLVLIDGNERHTFPMTAEQHGYFSHTKTAIAEQQHYAYRLDGGPERPDPASLWQPQGVHRPSAVLRPERFRWSDAAWSGIERKDLVFYELHVGTFTSEGTFDAIIPRLGTLRDLGITAVELMPVGQFPGTRNWGYDGVHLFAPQNSYGGPHGLHRLVDACHATGLAVFLDVVYNHLGPEGNYLGEFGPYFSDRYRTFWGPAFNFDGAGCDPVRDFILENVRLWIAGYHFDGLRLDAVHAIYDIGPRHILRAIKEAGTRAAGRLERRVHIIAESNLNDARLLQPPEVGGHGLDAQWHDDFHHAVHSYLTGERQGYYADFGRADDFPKLFEKTFLLDGCYSRYRDRCHGAPVGDLLGDQFVISIQNHDQVGNRARGERLSRLLSSPAQRLAASLLLLAPHLPLMFMGEEYGEDQPFLFFCSFLDADLIERVREGRRREFTGFGWQGEVPDPQAEATWALSRLSWSWPDESSRAGLRRLYRDLLTARRSWPALQDFERRAARLVSRAADTGQPEGTKAAVLELIRGGKTPIPGVTLRIEFNLSNEPQPSAAGSNSLESLLFSSEAKRYAGARTETDSLLNLLPYECLVYGPTAWEKLV
jgi:maltooligosyltrehalose trehalohydrolase